MKRTKKRKLDKLTYFGVLVLIFVAGTVYGVRIGERRGAVAAYEDTAEKIKTSATAGPTKSANDSAIPTANDGTKLKYMGMYETTAYCACVKCCGKTDGITASGKLAKAGRTIAADTSILPFGTEIYIEGHKYVVEDRGGAIKGKRIDIYFDSHDEALEYGRKTVKVYTERYD